MKTKTTAVLLAVFVLLLAFVLFVEKKPQEAGSKPEEKLVTLAAADLQSITLKREADKLAFKKDDKGEWIMTEPFEAKADSMEIGNLTDALADLRVERVVEIQATDLKKYEIPKIEITFAAKGQAKPVRILLGAANKIDATYYAQKEGDPRVVLLPGSLKTPLEKKVFDFRQKDIFRFETKDVSAISVRAKDVRWEARKKDDEWSLTAPLPTPAKESKMTGILDSLSGLRAKEFTSEDKKPAEIKTCGLDKPEYSVVLKMAAGGKEIVYTFHKADEKTFATTSLSTKIIVPESDVLPDLEKKAADLRESKVLPFSSWQASKLMLKKGALALTATKASNEKWYFDAAQKEEADVSKIDTFIRKIEGLEASDYIDSPKGPAEYGLDKAQAEVTVWTKDNLGDKPVEKSFGLLVGSVDKDKKQAVVKNVRFANLYRVDSAFLDEFPKDKKDWNAPPPAKKEDKK